MCSIGEDDFGDEGGLHGMIKDSDSKEPNNLAGNCSKCGTEGTLFKLKFREPECSNCFLAYARHKFRATLGSSKILPKGAEVLLLFDGSAQSIVLLDMMHYAQKQNTFKRLHVETKILFIDESSIDSSHCIDDVKEFLSNYEFEKYAISITNDNSLCKLEEFKLSDINSKEQESLLPQHVKTLTSRQDFIKLLKNKVTEIAAEKLKCNYVFSSDISTNLASELINSIALGRGGSAALDVALLDDRFTGVKLLRPLRTLSANEVKLYLDVKNLKPLKKELYGVSLGPNASIQNLTKQFVEDLQENFSSTVSTIFRTGDKIAPKVANGNSLDDSSKCKLCKSRLNIVPSKTIQALEFSRHASAYSGNMDNFKSKESFQTVNFPDGICHACTNIQNDTEETFIPR